MANALHSKQRPSDGIHIPHSYEYADASARTSATGFDSLDVGKWARQLDDNSYWVLTSTAPTWALISSAAALSGSVSMSRTITAGAGLTGGGTSGAVSLSVGADPGGSILVTTGHISVGVINATQHGIQTGSNLHALATTGSAGFMSAEALTALIQLVSGSMLVPIRNETGGTLLKGYAVAVVGWDPSVKTYLVDYADCNSADRRPAIAVLGSNILNNTTSTGIVQGILEDVDTSAWLITDQLILGPSGTLVRPPPDNPSATGEIQNLGSVVRSHPSQGDIFISIDGLSSVDANQKFALQGTTGTPGNANRYVTEIDPRLFDDRVTHALRSATTVVYVTGSTPFSGSKLSAISATEAIWEADNDVQLTTTTPVTVYRTTPTAGTSSLAARSDHRHDVLTGIPSAATPGDSSSEGTSGSLARQDHKHALPAFGTTANTFAQGNDSRFTDERVAYALSSATTHVYVSASAAPTAGQVLTAIDSTTASWQAANSGSLPTGGEVVGTSTVTTTSVTAVLLTGMTVTPAAGNYIVWFGGDWNNNTNSATGWMSVYVGGSLIKESERSTSRQTATQPQNFSTCVLVTVNGAQAIEGRWRTSAGTSTNTRRTLVYLKVA